MRTIGKDVDNLERGGKSVTKNQIYRSKKIKTL